MNRLLGCWQAYLHELCSVGREHDLPVRSVFALAVSIFCLVSELLCPCSACRLTLCRIARADLLLL
jgi:hypothetical protein